MPPTTPAAAAGTSAPQTAPIITGRWRFSIVAPTHAIATASPAASADADEIVKQAEAYRESKINEANGQAARCEELFNEYQKYPLITKQRLFYEAMEEILPDMKLYIVDEAAGVQTSIPLEPYATLGQEGSENE